jgi:hypothetical protein
MAGRPASYRPFRYTHKGLEYGPYRVYDPKSKKTVDLETEDFNVASEKVEVLRRGFSGTDGGQTNQIISNPVVELELPSDVSKGDSFEALKAWAKDGTPETVNAESIKPPIDNGSGKPSLPVSTLPGLLKSVPQKKRGLTPEQLTKLSESVTKLVIKANVIGGELLVRLIGRDPYELGEDDLDLLKLGWEMQLEELLQGVKIKPAYLIIGANVLMLFTMYVNGKPIQKKQITTKNQDELVNDDGRPS